MTDARVGMLNKDGTVTAILVNSDAYPEGLGKTLIEHYMDENKVNKLISLGDCSCVEREVEPPEGETHTYDDPLDYVTVAYVRDRGEDWEDCEPNLYESEDSYWQKSGKYVCYGYLFKDGKWLCKKGYGGKIAEVSEYL